MLSGSLENRGFSPHHPLLSIHRLIGFRCAKSPFLHLASEQDALATILLLRSRGQHLIHAIGRIIHRDRRLYHPESPRAQISRLRLYEAWVEHEGIEPVVLGVDPDPVPKHHRLRSTVRRVRDWRLTAASSSHTPSNQ